MESAEAVRELVMVDPVDLEAIRETARLVGAELAEMPPIRGIHAVTTAVLLVGVPRAVTQVQQEIERRKGGAVFDLRVGATRPIYRTKRLRQGTADVLTMDGRMRIAGCGADVNLALTQLASWRGPKTVGMVLDAVGTLAGEIEIDSNHYLLAW